MILAGTDDGIYRWYEGAPWLTFHSLQGRPIVDIASPGPGVITALDDGGRIWETTNNGLDWREIPLPSDAGRPTSLAVWGAPSELIVATRPLGFLRRPIGAPLPEEPPVFRKWWDRAWSFAEAPMRRESGGGTATAAPPTSPSSSRHESLGWTRLGKPEVPALPGGLEPAVRTLSRANSDDAPWFAAINGAGLWRTDDSGTGWVQCPGLPAEVYAIRAVPKKPGSLLVATNDGCWSSADNGQTWTDLSAGLEGFRHLRAVEVRPDDPKHLLAGAAPSAPGEGDAAPDAGLGFRLYESKDAGKSWTHVQKGFPTQLEYDTIDDIRWDPEAPGFAILALASGECWRTRSEGAWWEPIARQIQAARTLCAVS